MIPFVDREFRDAGEREHRGCFGKSSGGYGAMIHGMKYATALGRDRQPLRRCLLRLRLPLRLAEHAERAGEATACRSARPGACDARAAARRLGQGADDGRIRRFLRHVWKKEKLSGKEGHAIMNVCMAATYDPDPRAPLGFRMPFNAETGELIEARWRNWLKHDPINLVAPLRGNLKTLRGIYIDCGWRDQYHIHYGTRMLSRRLGEAGIRHLRGVRRRPLRHRLPHGREPAFPLSRAALRRAATAPCPEGARS
jgi:hypothetical protein